MDNLINEAMRDRINKVIEDSRQRVKFEGIPTSLAVQGNNYDRVEVEWSLDGTTTWDKVYYFDNSNRRRQLVFYSNEVIHDLRLFGWIRFTAYSKNQDKVIVMVNKGPYAFRELPVVYRASDEENEDMSGEINSDIVFANKDLGFISSMKE